MEASSVTLVSRELGANLDMLGQGPGVEARARVSVGWSSSGH